MYKKGYIIATMFKQTINLSFMLILSKTKTMDLINYG